MKVIVLVVAISAVAYFVWDRYFSRDARIERVYQGCMKDVETGAGKANAMTSLLQSIGGTTCVLLRDACRNSFDGITCQAALARYR